MIEIHRDTIAEKLDEMADLSEHWKRNRDKGRNPNAIRTAMMMLAHEVTLLAQRHDRETAEMMDRLCGPTAYWETDAPDAPKPVEPISS